MSYSNPNSAVSATPEIENPQKLEVFTYWHRNRAIVLIPAKSASEADRVYRRQYGALGPVQDNVYAGVGK
jgi:hypothetical protein